MTMNSAAMFATVCAFTDRDWYAFPLHYPIFATDGTVTCSCGDANCTGIGKHPLTPSGYHAATIDRIKIERFCNNELYPTPNFAIALAKSGLVIVAPDSEKWHEEFKRRGLPDTYTVKSGKGWHYYYRNIPISGPKARICQSQQYDILSDGFIVAAGSVHRSGKVYTVLNDVQDLPDAPRWVIDLLYEEEERANSDIDGTQAVVAWQSDVPPVKLSKADMEIWCGEKPAYKSDGVIDRSKTLFKIACSLAKKGVHRDTIASALKNRDNVLFDGDKFGGRSRSDAAYLHTAQSAIDRAAHVQPNGTGHITNSVTVKTSPIGYNRTDVGNAERFAQQHGAYVRWIEEMHKWAIYDGKRWLVIANERMKQFAIQTVRGIYHEAAETENARERAELGEWAHISEGNTRLNAMLDIARGLDGIIVSYDEFDVDKYLFNVMNGTLDLRTRTIRPHNPADMLMKLAPVEYQPGIISEKWLRFLMRVQPSDEMQRYLARLAFYLLTGETKEEVFFIFYGGGANGKGTWVESIQALLGDYAQTVPMQTFIKSSYESGEKASPDIARMKGARMVTATEINEGTKFNTALIKNHTGGDTISARFLNQGYFDFSPMHKLLFSVNMLPDIVDTSGGMWRRPHVIPFNITIAEHERDNDLKRVLRDEELTGVLNWIFEYGAVWLSEGLHQPETVKQATEEYKTDSDVIQGWIDACCAIDPKARTTNSELYENYKFWCGAHDYKYETVNVWSQRLRMKIRELKMFPPSDETYRTMSERGYKGIRLLRWDEKPTREITFTSYKDKD